LSRSKFHSKGERSIGIPRFKVLVSHLIRVPFLDAGLKFFIQSGYKSFTVSIQNQILVSCVYWDTADFRPCSEVQMYPTFKATLIPAGFLKKPPGMVTGPSSIESTSFL
jgi:hypothetical protein